MKKIVLTGNDLTIDEVWEVAVNGAKVEIAPEADARLEESRKIVYELVDKNFPVYGFNTGVGWNKDHKIDKSHFEKFNKSMIFSHSMGIKPEATEAEVRAIMLVRLNTLLCGHTGIQPAVAHHYAVMLNEGISPVMYERGSVGEADIGLLSHIGLAMIGEGEVNYKGERMSSLAAHKKAGVELVTLGPKDSLAIIDTNAFGAGEAALVLKDVKDLIKISDLVYAVSLEGFDGNTSPLDEEIMSIRKLPGQEASAAEIRKYIEGSYIYDPDPQKAVQDPICFRSGAHINGALRDAAEFAEKFLNIQMNSSDDNPCVLLGRRTILSTSNYEVPTLAMAYEMLGLALSHLSRMSCYRMIKLDTPAFTHLSRFLCHDSDNGESHCFGAFQKAFTSLDTRIRHLSNPLTTDFMPLAGDIEDHASNLPLVTQKLAQMSDDLKYVYGMELIHACQAIDLRMRTNKKLKLGKATQKIWKEFRKGIKLYESERPLAPDIQKAYEFVKELGNLI